MKKKIVFVLAALVLFAPNIMAAEKKVSKFDELTEALKSAESGDTIKLTDNITFDNHLIVSNEKKLTVDLNGFNLTGSDEKTIIVSDGELTITGEGTISLKDSYLNVWGIEDSTSKSKSILNVDKDVTIKSTSTGIAVFYDVKNAYNTEVNFAGTIEAVDIGITVNGIIVNENGPVINIKKGSSIVATDKESTALYGAGNGTYNIEEETTLKGASAVEIRAGKLNVKGGTFISTGKTLETNPHGDGATTIGAGIAVVQHTTKLPIDVTISGGNINGVKALYVNNTQNNPEEDWKKVNVSVTGGTFSTSVKEYVAKEYIEEEVDNKFVVAKKEVNVDTPTIDTTKPVTEVTVGVKENEELSNTLKDALNKSDIDVANVNAIVLVEITNQKETEVPEEATNSINNLAKENGKIKLLSFFDITLAVKNNITGEALGNLTELNNKIKFNMALPENLTKVEEGYTRKYYIVRYHDGKSEMIPATVDGNVLTFESDKFSTYALAYEDTAPVVVPPAEVNPPVENPPTGDNVVCNITIGLISIAGIGLVAKIIAKRKKYFN